MGGMERDAGGDEWRGGDDAVVDIAILVWLYGVLCGCWFSCSVIGRVVRACMM